MKVAIYSRVSVGGVQTVENQVIELRRYVEARGWTIFKEYADEGVKAHRKTQLEARMKAGDRWADQGLFSPREQEVRWTA